MSEDDSTMTSAVDTGREDGDPGHRGGPPADREEVAALEAEPPGDDIGPAAEDDPGEDPQFLGPD